MYLTDFHRDPLRFSMNQSRNGFIAVDETLHPLVDNSDTRALLNQGSWKLLLAPYVLA